MGDIEIDVRELMASLSPQTKLLKLLDAFSPREIEFVKQSRSGYLKILLDPESSYDVTLPIIQYEMGFYIILKKRDMKPSVTSYRDTIVSMMGIFINKLFILITRRFPNETQMWILHIRFCQDLKYYSTLMFIVDEFVNIHTDKPSNFRIVARCARNDLRDVEKARFFLRKGLVFHPDSEEIYLESFSMEINEAILHFNTLNIQRVLSEDEELRVMGKATNVYCEMRKKPTVSFESYCKAHSFVKHALFAPELVGMITDDLKDKFYTKPQMWDYLAKAEFQLMKDPDYSAFKYELLANGIDFYLEGMDCVDSCEMWKLYLLQLVEIHGDPAIDLNNYKSNCLMSAFVQAHNNEKLDEELYVLWADNCEPKRHEEMLRTYGLKALPNSAQLWQRLVKNKMTTRSIEDVWLTFNDAMVNLESVKPTTLPIWRMMCRFFQLAAPSKVREVFDLGSKESSGVADQLRVDFLEWCILSKGLPYTRQVYDSLASQPPFTLTFHEKMIELEGYLPTCSRKRMRKVFNFAIEQLGAQNAEIWVKYIKFELEYGKISNVNKIAHLANTHLNQSLQEDFDRQYQDCRRNAERERLKKIQAETKTFHDAISKKLRAKYRLCPHNNPGKSRR